MMVPVAAAASMMAGMSTGNWAPGQQQTAGEVAEHGDVRVLDRTDDRRSSPLPAG
jgi:hypothetical protein